MHFMILLSKATFIVLIQYAFDQFMRATYLPFKYSVHCFI